MCTIVLLHSQVQDTNYSCDFLCCNQLFISAVFLVLAVLCVNITILPCAVLSCIYSIKVRNLCLLPTTEVLMASLTAGQKFAAL